MVITCVHLERRVHAATPEQMVKYKADLEWLWDHPPFSWLPTVLAEHITELSYAQWLPCLRNYWRQSDEEMLNVLKKIDQADKLLAIYEKRADELHKIYNMTVEDLTEDLIHDYSYHDYLCNYQFAVEPDLEEILMNVKHGMFRELTGNDAIVAEDALDIMEEEGCNFYECVLCAHFSQRACVCKFIGAPSMFDPNWYRTDSSGQRVDVKAPLQGWQLVPPASMHPVTRHFCVNGCEADHDNYATYSLTDLTQVEWDAPLHEEDKKYLCKYFCPHSSHYRHLFDDEFVEQLREISARGNPADYRVFFAYCY